MTIKTYTYGKIQKIYNIIFAIALLGFALYLVSSIQGFSTIPYIIVPLALIILSFHKVMKLKSMIKTKYLIDLKQEKLIVNNEVFKLKDCTNLDITKKRGIEYFTVTTDTGTVKIIGDFFEYMIIRNEIIEIVKKYNENVYSLLKRQSSI